jgi:hypothetical protein
MTGSGVPWGVSVRLSIVPDAQHFPDEDADKAMRIAGYLICALSIAILVALLLYTILT